MPFLLSTTGNRKKKSYIHNINREESSIRREMVKQKLYALHMMDDEDGADTYLQLELCPASSQHQKGQHQKHPHRHLNRSSHRSELEVIRRVNRSTSASNYIDHSGSLTRRKPVRRAYSDNTGQKSKPKRGKNASPLQPKRVRSNRRIYAEISHKDEEKSDNPVEISPPQRRQPPRLQRRDTVATESLQESADAAMRFGPPRKVKSYYPGEIKPRNSNFHKKPMGVNKRGGLDISDHSNISTKSGFRRSPISTMSIHENDAVDFYDDVDDEESGNSTDSSDEFYSPTPPRSRSSPPQQPRGPQRRVTVATESLQKSADAAMRFGPPRKIKSYYPGANKPKNSNFHVSPMGINKDDNLDVSNHSNKEKKGGHRRGRLFRKFSGNSDDTEDTASSSDHSTSFFRAVRRTKSANQKPAISSRLKASLKRNQSSTPLLSPLTSHSDHSTASQLSQKSWFTSGGNTLKSAPSELPSHRRKNEIYSSAVQRAKENQAIKRGNLSLLTNLPRSDKYDNTEFELISEDDDKESKSIFSSIISKIEDIYDDCK